MIARPVVERVIARPETRRWRLAEADVVDTLERSAAQRFRGTDPSADEVAAYVDALHLEDLWLAVACAAGLAEAWDHFVLQFRPVLYRTAAAVAGPESARDLADSLYADLYGLGDRDGNRRSLFRYYHGRSSLAGWLRAVLAQRAVDHAREQRRTTALDDLVPSKEPASPPACVDPERDRYLAAFQQVLLAVLASLDPRDRLRLSLYYTQSLTLAETGRLLGEHESTVSRKLERTRRQVRRAVEQGLRDVHALAAPEIALCFEYALGDWAVDFSRALHEPSP